MIIYSGRNTDITFTVKAAVVCGTCDAHYTIDVPVDFEDMPTKSEVEIFAHIDDIDCPFCGQPLDADIMFRELDEAQGPTPEFHAEARPCPPKGTKETEIPVAVYGTLRDGFGNDGWSWKKSPTCHSLGLAMLADHKLVMRTPGAAFPYCVEAEGHTTIVELISVDRDMLDRFDALEGVETRHYDRCLVRTVDGTLCWVYLAGEWIGSDNGRWADVPGLAEGHHDWACLFEDAS